MLESRPEDALVELVKTVETEETVWTEDLKKVSLTQSVSYRQLESKR